MSAIIPDAPMPMDGGRLNSSDQGKRSSYEPSEPMPFSFGESLLMTAAKLESTAQSSAMSQAIEVHTSYDKRIRLLIASGLIAGITPTSTRKGSPQATLDFAFSRRGGGGADEPKADC
jgi:hypothetical protein